MPYVWAHIESGATFHALVGNLLFHEDPLALVFNREGPDGAIDALSSDRKTVYQSKHHKSGTATDAFADAKGELAKIRKYRQAGQRWYETWKDVDNWTLISNVPFGPGDEERWHDEIVPAFAAIGLTATFALQPKLEEWLTRHPDVADAYFGHRPRLFISLAEHRETLVQREVLERSYDVPFEGRTAERDELKVFVKTGQEKVKLVHGPGGTGKSRLLYETACQLVEERAVDTVYCGTPHLEAAGDWYVGIVPEAKALVILDEPADHRFVERFLAELRTRTKQWKVLVAVRSPRDPVIQVLTDPREHLLAKELELQPLPESEAVKYAEALLAPLAFSPEQGDRAVRWLVDVCGRFPIWMTVAVRLLEDRGDLTALPTDEFRIAAAYVRDILDHTRPEIGGVTQILALLRWIALVQPINRTADGVLAFLADRTGIGDAAAVDRGIEDLSRRRVVSAYGMSRRLVEVRPDVLRDHLLIDWLTYPSGSGRQPSPDAGAIANQLATAALAGVSTPFDEHIVTSLARMEFLVEPPLDFLGPVADAAVRMAATAADTLGQEKIVAFASPLAFVRPLHLARVARLVRTRDVPEAVLQTAFGSHSTPRLAVVDSLALELFKAAQGAGSSEERRAILSELGALADEQSSRSEPPRQNDGNAAVNLIQRILHERHGYRSSFHGEAVAYADGFLVRLARGEEPTASGRAVLRALLDIERHDAHTDESDELKLHVERFRIVPDGEFGRAVIALRERLWKMVAAGGLRPAVAKLVWDLLDHLHGSLNQASDDAVWSRLLGDDLAQCHGLASKAGVSLEDLQAARALWEWHLKYDEAADRKHVAEDCETAYLAHPLIRIYAPLFGGDDFDSEDRLRDVIVRLPSPLTTTAISQFLTDALLFTSTHAQDWHGNRVHRLAWLLGELRGSDAGAEEFITASLKRGTSYPLFRHAISIAAGRVHALRVAKDFPGAGALLERLVPNLMDETVMGTFVSAIYAEVGRMVVREFSRVDYDFLMSHWAAFSKLPDRVVFLILGRFLAKEERALAASKDRMMRIDRDSRGDSVAALWHGYFDTLPSTFAEADVSALIVDHLLELTLLVPDLHRMGGNMAAWEIGEILKRAQRKQPSWLVHIVRARIAAFGEFNRKCAADQKAGCVWLLPDVSCVLDVVEPIPDRSATAAEMGVISEIFGMAADDWTIEHRLPEFLARIDPHGRAATDLILERMNDPLQTSSLEALARWSRFAGRYGLDSPAWRRIAIAACQRAGDIGLSEAERYRVYSTLIPHRGMGWSGSPKELHPRWQRAVDGAQKSLDEETEPALRPFWEWRRKGAQQDLERERGRLEEPLW